MSKNIDQIFIANPITSNLSTDLMYFGQSPYGAGNDAAMTYANFSAQFGAPFTPAALTEVNDTNVILTLGGTPSTALLQATSITAGWTGTLSGARGGTGVANTGLTIDLSGGATGKVLTSDSSGNATWQASTAPTSTQVQQNAFNSASDGGIVNQYDLVLSPVASSYTDNLTLLFSPANTNTSTTPTIQINAQSAKTIVKAGGALEAGDIVAGTNALLIYSASNGNFELINPQKGSSAAWSTFSPTVTLVGGTGNTVPTFTINSGRFMINGKIAFVRVVLGNDSGGTAGAGTGQINVALPVAVGASVVAGGSNTAWNFGVGWFNNNNTNTADWLLGNLVASATTIALGYANTAGTNVATLTGAQLNNANIRYITLNFSYEID